MYPSLIYFQAVLSSKRGLVVSVLGAFVVATESDHGGRGHEGAEGGEGEEEDEGKEQGQFSTN